MAGKSKFVNKMACMLLPEHEYKNVYLITAEGNAPYQQLIELAGERGVGVTSYSYRELDEVSNPAELLVLPGLLIWDDCTEYYSNGKLSHFLTTARHRKQ
jgi:hypothetical protein